MHTDVIVLTVPADAAFISVIRATAATVAARQSLHFNDIEDIRGAIDEACSLIMEHASPQETLRCAFDLGNKELTIEVSVPTQTRTVNVSDSFAWTVLSALADKVNAEIVDQRFIIEIIHTYRER